MPETTLAEKMLKMNEGISGYENSPEIQNELMKFNYDPPRVATGRTLWNNTNDIISYMVNEYGSQYIATSEFNKLKKDVYGNYMVTLKVVRVALVDEPEILRQLNATGARNRSLAGWLKDSKIMYTNILNNPEVIEVLREYGYTPEKLFKESEDVTKVEQLHSLQLKEKGLAQQSTIERDKAFDELCKWYSKFRAIARIALYDKPQLLESLGITVKR
jgi:hypothetical protein